jgi:hypothetical protein
METEGGIEGPPPPAGSCEGECTEEALTWKP